MGENQLWLWAIAKQGCEIIAQQRDLRQGRVVGSPSAVATLGRILCEIIVERLTCEGAPRHRAHSHVESGRYDVLLSESEATPLVSLDFVCLRQERVKVVIHIDEATR
jgi:hypothetical protein